MGGLFNPEGKFMRYGAKIWDMMWLNVLTILCSLPIVTAGPALAAMHYVLYKIYRDEESGVTKLFFKSFGQNFKQGILIQAGFLVVAYLLVASLQVLRMQGMEILFWLVVVVAAMVICVWMWTFILLSRYNKPIVKLLKTALAICTSHPFRTVFMAALALAPGFVLLFTEKALVFVIALGLTGPGMVHALWYHGVFKKLETPLETKEEAT